MKVHLLAIGLVTGLFMAERTWALPTLTGLIGFSASSDGSALGGEIWNTRGADGWYNLYVIEGAADGVFINSGDGAEARISIPLTEGTHTFTLFGEIGAEVPHQALNLFFDGDDVNPGISVVAELNQSATPPFPAFTLAGAAGSRALDGETLVNGAGTLLFTSGAASVELTDFRWSVPNVYNLDRVDAVTVGPNGNRDAIGQFTLQVTVPEPSGTCLAGSLAAIWVARRRRGDKDRRHVQDERPGSSPGGRI